MKMRPESPLQNRRKMRQTEETWKKTRQNDQKYDIQLGKQKPARKREETRR
jgi:hypothetical protein